MILVIPIFCRPRWMNLNTIYILTILMVLTRPLGYILSSIELVIILCRATNSSKKTLATMLLGDTRGLIADLCACILGSQYQHANCIQIRNGTPSWSTSYLCCIFHGCSVFPFLLVIKLLVSKVGMCIRSEYPTIIRGVSFRRILSTNEDIITIFLD